MKTMRILMPLPDLDFDPSEAAVPWWICHEAGHEVCFATPSGRAGAADPSMLTGQELDPWGRLPLLRRMRLFGLILRADGNGRAAYARMRRDDRFNAPLRYGELAARDFDALILPGGHYARGMRTYLEDPTLQRFVGDFFDLDRPVGAVCHGVVLAARSTSPRTSRSVLFNRKTTSLTWSQERLAHRLGRVLRWWEPNYYRTCPEEPGEPYGYRSVQSEVSRALASPADFLEPPRNGPDYFRKTAGLWRDTPTDARPAWVVQDGNYVSARWPGDVHTFAHTFCRLLGGR